MNNTAPKTTPQILSPGKAYFSEKEVAKRLSMSCKWLQKMRLSGGGIPFCKMGGAVRYAVADIVAFEERSKRSSTSNTGK